ncbi:phosphoesterase, partial [Fangia hongkongensis]|nr:phosphoesterase [Fangia hongkongensis]
KSTIVRAKSFYAAPPKTSYIGLNQFLKVEPLSESYIRLVKLSGQKTGKQIRCKLDPVMLHSELLQSDDVKPQVEISEIHSDKGDKKEPLNDINEKINSSIENVESKQVRNTEIKLLPDSVLFGEISIDDKLNSPYFDVEHASFNDRLINLESIYKFCYRFNTYKGVGLVTSRAEIEKRINMIKLTSEDYLKGRENSELNSLFKSSIIMNHSEEVSHDD